MDISENKITFYVKNYEFARDFLHNRGWGNPVYNSKFQAYGIIQQNS